MKKHMLIHILTLAAPIAIRFAINRTPHGRINLPTLVRIGPAAPIGVIR